MSETTDRSLDSLRPTETLDLESGLSLVPRVKILLTIHRADKSVTPIDEWKLKRSLVDYLKTSSSITVPEEDIDIRKFKDLKKRKREDPLARGNLVIRDLAFLSKVLSTRAELNEDEDDVKLVEEKFLKWRRGLVDGMDGMELNLEGTKFRLTVTLPASDDFEGMKKEWEEISAFGSRGFRKQQPDTIVMRGVPSRWFAETRVSSKPSMLVSHTIFSKFGRIRNLDVAEDDDIGKDAAEDADNIVSGLQCKIVVRFEEYMDFHNTLRVLCGRSLIKQGSRLKADYEVTWDKDGFFRNARNHVEENGRRTPATSDGRHRYESSRWQPRNSQFSHEDTRRKRFKE